MKHIKQLVLSDDFEIEEDINKQDSDDLNTNRKGDFAEYYAVTWLWDQGYEVFQNSGCTGPVDMIAMDEGHGFRKKFNRDYYTNAVSVFFKKYLKN